jgi:hypothetical protein
MPKLEARFHPWNSGAESYVVVGYVIWDATGNDTAQVEPAASLRAAHAPRAILATLRYLVRTTGTSFSRLAALQSRFWSFVPADEPGDDRANEPAAS